MECEYEDEEQEALVYVEPIGTSNERVRRRGEEEHRSVGEDGGRTPTMAVCKRAPPGKPAATAGAAGEGRRESEEHLGSSIELIATPGSSSEHHTADPRNVSPATPTNIETGLAPAPSSRRRRRHHHRRHRSHDFPPTARDVVATATLAVARFLPVAKLFCRVTRAALRMCAAFAAVLVPALALAGFAGLWPWRDLFPYHGELFDAEKQCRRVRTGPEEACGAPWEAPCFDRGRCRTSATGGGGKSSGGGFFLSVYVHDETCSMKRSSEIVTSYRGVAVPLLWNEAAKAVRHIAAERGLLAETPDEACIIFYAVPEEGECVSKTATWRDGQNHVILDLNDQSRDARPSLNKKAMFAQSTMRPCYYRQGFDIALPLRARKMYHGLRRIAPQDRKYFATFKGTLYLTGNGMAERTAMLDLGRAGGAAPSTGAAATAAVAPAAETNGLDLYANNSGGNGDSDIDVFPRAPSDVVVVERCHDLHNEQLLSWNKALCESLQREYDHASYDDLMNTTFALLPAGRSPATYRLGEALSAGAIPVFVHQDYVKPFPDLIPWSEFSFSFPAEEAPRILDTLRAVTEKELAQMQVTALRVFDTFFGRGMEGVVHTTLDILEDRLAFRSRRSRKWR